MNGGSQVKEAESTPASPCRFSGGKSGSEVGVREIVCVGADSLPSSSLVKGFKNVS